MDNTTMRLMCLCVMVLLSLPAISSTTVSVTEKSAVRMCRDRDRYLEPTLFRLKACASCYKHLFPRKRKFAFYKDFYMITVTETTVNGSVVRGYKHVIPEIYNRTSRTEICRTLNADECERWAHCCVEAVQCCHSQLSSAPSSAGSCPKTWDGYSCWNEAEKETTVSLPCPTFLEHARPSVSAYKTCTANATWFVHESGLEWTNYTRCLDVTKHKIVTYIGIACEAASLAVLIPAVLIFLSYRLLRKQQRIKLHVNLFLSFILTGTVYILWGTVVVLNRLEVPNRETVMHQNSPGCKFLCAMTRYTRAANYIWVLCEGFYLHRLIVRTFEPPKKLLVYYILGWGFPFIPISVYSTLRTIYSDKNCWVANFGAFEWLIYAPNLICLVLNLIFLCNILRILLTQLQSHPNEPSNYRRALKATFILIPLFGLQLTLIIYRPPFDSPASHVYEIIAAIITHSQGFFAALIFCFFNGEVFAQLRKTWLNSRGKNRLREKRRESTTTQFTSEYNSRQRNSNRSDKSYIPMTAVPEKNGHSKRYA